MKQGWITTEGRTEDGQHDCRRPFILAQSGLFAPKVGALWGCKCGRVWEIVRTQPPADVATAPVLEWQERHVKLGNRKYQVRPGDTLTGLAVQFDTTVPELCWLNGIKHPNELRPDTFIVVPAPTLAELTNECVKALPAGWLRFAPEDAVPHVLRYLAANGFIALSDVPREG